MASSMRNSLLKCAVSYNTRSQLLSVFAKSKPKFYAHISKDACTRNVVSMSSSMLMTLRRNDQMCRVHRIEHTAKVHTELDAKLSEFIKDELSKEKESGGELKANGVEGWKVETDGTGVILTKSFKDESIKVEFDVNDTVDQYPEGLYDDPQQAEAESPALVSKPPFEVEIKKKSGRTLTFMCEFREQEMEGQPEEEEGVDQFDIVEMRVDQPSDGVTKENFYSHSTSFMEGELYDMLMDMLDERGIDNKFINNLVNFASAHQHQLYITFLNKVHSFVKEK
ncbi:complement component 1 Q subcomponent-binding protein, mitochondrial-like isoform X2 [Dreissena polymorpha]|uniref:complement component 1 Q subcomponent-binding protein, mitochondrial-like isoform X2 n=1 Tax=Dreissena polymorpha TaxID=45954 RepID=UPI002264659B|nr:complement component 1 Q subcomponent-binding protein, mitochondrial-like isoform X2 [Dreissena polymorpha]